MLESERIETTVETGGPNYRGDLFARVIGFLVFAGGVAIILWVLWLAFALYKDPNMGLGRAQTTPGGVGTTATDLGSAFLRLVFRIALLALGSVSGSLIANKGIHLYFAGLPAKKSP